MLLIQHEIYSFSPLTMMERPMVFHDSGPSTGCMVWPVPKLFHRPGRYDKIMQ